jgi:excinuclease ABC subunit C
MANNLFPTETFEGFGPSLFRPLEEAVVGLKVRGKRASRLLKGVREQAPRQPGVYGMIDDRNRIVYVGKAKNLRARLLSYFRGNSRDSKAAKIIQSTSVLVWEQTGDELAALLRELELIQELRPRFNVLGIPGLQRHHYVCIGKSPAPHVYITNSPTGKEQGVYGPLVARTNSEEAVRRLNDWFKLRDCPQTVPMAFSDQPVLFPDEPSAKCLRFELSTCQGPCVAACSRKGYTAGVRAAKAFLDGRDRSLIRAVRARMEEASEALQYEKASAMRDRLEAIEWLDARLSLLRQARDRNSFVYPLTGTDGRERWYLIHRGQVRAVCFPPTLPDELKRTAALLDATFTNRPAATILKDGAVDSVLLVAAWFRKHHTERAKLLSKNTARSRCTLNPLGSSSASTPTPSFEQGLSGPLDQISTESR